MQITIHSVSDLGLALRAVRHSSKVRLDDLAGMAGVSKQFASEVEHGKPTVRIDKVLAVFVVLGLELRVAEGKSLLRVARALRSAPPKQEPA